MACQFWHSVTSHKHVGLPEKLSSLHYCYYFILSLFLFFHMDPKQLSSTPISIPQAKLLIPTEFPSCCKKSSLNEDPLWSFIWSSGFRNICHSLHFPSECTWNSDKEQKKPQQNSPPTTRQEKYKPVVINSKEFTGTSLTFTKQIPCWELLAWLEVSGFLPPVQCCVSDDNLRIICPQLAHSRDGQFTISSTDPHNIVTRRGHSVGSVWLSNNFSQVFMQDYSQLSTTLL